MSKTVYRHGFIKCIGHGSFSLTLALGILFLSGDTLPALVDAGLDAQLKNALTVSPTSPSKPGSRLDFDKRTEKEIS